MADKAKGEGKRPDREEGFLGRWSRLKQSEQERADPSEPPASGPVAETVPAVAGGTDPDPAAETASPAELDLPPIESLDRESDFTVFMKPGVPAALRQSALRKLWRSDPALANLDGLLEYGDDFTLPWKNKGVVATIYQVGKGMVQSLTAEPPEGELATAPETAAADASEPVAPSGDPTVGHADSAGAKEIVEDDPAVAAKPPASSS